MIDFGYGVSLGPLDYQYMETIRAWRNDERVRKWCRQYDLISEQAHADWFSRQAKDPSVRMYAVLVDGKIAGVCGLTSIDQVNRRAEFSLYIDPDAHGNGLGTKALKTLLQHGFLAFGLNCIWGETFAGNPAANLFEKLGMKKEGTRRDFYYRAGRFIDCHLYSVLRSEFDTLLPAWKAGRAGTWAEAGVGPNTLTNGPQYSDVRPFAYQAG